LRSPRCLWYYTRTMNLVRFPASDLVRGWSPTLESICVGSSDLLSPLNLAQTLGRVAADVPARFSIRSIRILDLRHEDLLPIDRSMVRTSISRGSSTAATNASDTLAFARVERPTDSVSTSRGKFKVFVVECQRRSSLEFHPVESVANSEGTASCF
jgi:hypothetical protein